MDQKEDSLVYLWLTGKQKYTLPVYRALMDSSAAAQKLAVDVFSETKDQLHVSVQGYVTKILHGA